MSSTTYRGTIRNGQVVLDDGCALPDGTEVIVTLVEPRRGSPQALLAAMRAAPHVSHEAAEELRRIIEEGKQPVDWSNPLERD